MSSLFKAPKVEEPKKVIEKPLKQVQSRGRAGRTILAGSTTQTASTQKKSILGG
jgi:hypothetical protein